MHPSKLHVCYLILDYVVMFAADEAKSGDVVVKDMRAGSQVTVREELLVDTVGGDKGGSVIITGKY